jgi:hypothetical protein
MEEVGWNAIGIDWRIESVVYRMKTGIVMSKEKMGSSGECDATW